jgi:serine phosphatase RsbU (regulator of sigma subunit)/integral membrane sensor domain MASE1/anti-sigma regulatory factor (Ser/Thr protein kinase)
MDIRDRSWTWPERFGLWGRPALFLLVLAGYAAGAKAALLIIGMSGLQGVLFIPAGITVAFLIRLPRRLWWIVLTAAVMSEFILDVTGGFTVAASLGYAAANVVEPLLGASIVVAMCGTGCDLTRRRDVLWFSVGAVLAGPALGALAGALVDRILEGDELLVTFAQWWMGDAIGVVLVGGAILAWSSGPDRQSIFSRWGLLLTAAIVGGAVIVFVSTDVPIGFTVMIGIVLAGAVFGVRAVSVIALAITMTIAVIATLDPGGLIAGLSEGDALIVIKLQLGLFTLAGLFIAAESNERELATRRAAEVDREKRGLEEEQRRERELSLVLQKGLLPDGMVEHTQLELAARYESADDLLEVGGDWYDTFSLGDDRIGLVVGDVVGHGIKAVTSMGRLRTALSALSSRSDDPGSLLNEVDRFVGGPDGTDYATVFYAIIDLREHLVEYASAAHPPALLLDPGGEATWLDQAQSAPLYGDYSNERPYAVASFEPGSTLVLYSDGLIERRRESLDRGLDRLEELVQRYAGLGVSSICDELFARVGYAREDDAVVLVAREVATPPSKFRESFPASAGELRKLRAGVRSWAESCDLSPGVTDDLLLAVSEAASNSIRHAYGERDRGRVDVRIERRNGTLEIVVADEGHWKGSQDSGHPGMGRALIEAVTENFETNIEPGGTVVSFEMSLGSSL